MSNKQHNLLLKIAIVGDCKSGKTLLSKQLTNTDLSPNYIPTIALDMFILRTQIHKNINIKAHLWDTSGSKSYYSLIKSYFRACCAAIIVINMTEFNAFEQLIKWSEELRNTKREDGQTMIFSVFLDLSEGKYSDNVYNQIEKFCKKENIKLYNVKLQKNKNVEESMTKFLELINSYYIFGSSIVHGLNYYSNYDIENEHENDDNIHRRYNQPLLGDTNTINNCCSIL